MLLLYFDFHAPRQTGLFFKTFRPAAARIDENRQTDDENLKDTIKLLPAA